MNKILIFSAYDSWYMKRNAEYLARLLNDEFEIAVADIPYPPYKNFLSRFPETSPLQRSPDDYDLLVPLLATHWGVLDKDAYRKKTALIWYQANEGYYYDDLAGIAACTPFAEKSLENKKYDSVRWGIDTHIFKPLNFKKDPNFFHVGMVGNLNNPRRMTQIIIPALTAIKGLKLHLYVGSRPQSWHDIDTIGKGSLELIEEGEKDIIGTANIYNKLDLLVRCDSDPGYSFPVLEAAACGVPIVATDSGIDHEVVNAGGGVLIHGDRAYYQAHEKEVGKTVQEVVRILMDDRTATKNMGIAGMEFIRKQYTWDNHITSWREFFRKALKNANSNSR